jgi:uncharacterized protein (DUF2249 family)
MNTPSAAVQTIDLRLLGPCVERKAHVLRAFDGLTAGEVLQVLSDHLPNGLRRHLDELRAAAFDWTLLDAGPEVFRVEIRKRP